MVALFLFSISFADDSLVYVILQSRSKDKFGVRDFCEGVIDECPWEKPFRENTYTLSLLLFSKTCFSFPVNTGFSSL